MRQVSIRGRARHGLRLIDVGRDLGELGPNVLHRVGAQREPQIGAAGVHGVDHGARRFRGISGLFPLGLLDEGADRANAVAVRFEGRHAFVPAYFFLEEGDTVPCIYRLIREEDGWKIDSVQVLKRWPASRRLGGTRA